MGREKIKGSEWWNDEIRDLMRKKREDYGNLLQNRLENIKEECKKANSQLYCKIGIE